MVAVRSHDVLSRCCLSGRVTLINKSKLTSDSAGDSDFLIYLTLRVLFYDLIIAAGNVVADFCQGLYTTLYNLVETKFELSH